MAVSTLSSPNLQILIIRIINKCSIFLKIAQFYLLILQLNFSENIIGRFKLHVHSLALY